MDKGLRLNDMVATKVGVFTGRAKIIEPRFLPVTPRNAIRYSGQLVIMMARTSPFFIPILERQLPKRLVSSEAIWTHGYKTFYGRKLRVFVMN
jgi:hypothetical protein